MVQTNAIFNINFSLLITVVALLPLFSSLFCIIWSVLYNFEASTWTHCKVPNYLPSISAAIGSYSPQKYVWRICIALHCTPRFMFAVSYYGYYTQFHVGEKNTIYKSLAGFCSLLHIAENSALVTLTYISSTDHYNIHETSFIVFMVCSEVYMLLSCFLFKWGHTSHGRVMTHIEKKSFTYKVYLFIFNVSMFLLAVYMFLRHGWYCEPGVYTAFAACEYLVVFSNIAYHYTAKIDFHDRDVSLADGVQSLTDRKHQ